MSVRLIVTDDPANGSDRVAMYDSVTGWAFGPVFSDPDDAYRFVDFVQDKYDRDLRQLESSELSDAHARFVQEQTA